MPSKKKTKKEDTRPKHREELTEDERDPNFLGSPPEAPPMPGVPPSEAPQIDDETEVEPER